jgi:hypothetical protein
MIQVKRADDLERDAAALETQATELDRVDPSQAERARREASQLRVQASRLRRGRTDGVKFG